MCSTERALRRSGRFIVTEATRSATSTRTSSVDALVMAGPLLFAQLELLDLAGRGLRQRAERDRLGDLEASQVLAREGDQVVRGRDRAGPEGDERLRDLAPARVGHADHGHLE